MEIDRDVLMKVFLAESADNLSNLEESIVRMETDGPDAELIATIFRCAHTLKGNAESMGCDAVANMAHSLENVLGGVRSGALAVTGELVTVMLGATDAIGSMLREVAQGESAVIDRHQALLHRLELAALGRGDGKAAQVDRHETRLDPEVQLAARSLRVNLDHVEKLVALVGELSTCLTQVRTAAAAGTMSARLADRLFESDDLFGQLKEQVLRLRLAPVGRMFGAQLRVVRDLASSQGKLARLLVEGDETEVDSTIAEGLRDPLTQMIRNAIDHGLESPSARVKLGKDPVGTIKLGARHQRGRIVIWIHDDGAGFDRDAILARAEELGMVSASDKLVDSEIYALVFAPGFTTKEDVTELSGRGVGMDVVRRNIAALKGTITIESQKNRGSTITVSVPLTLAIINGFTVSAGKERYVIPLESVVECVELDARETRATESSGVFNLRGHPLPYLRLRETFELGGTRSKHESIVVVEHNGGRAGLAVDALHGQSETVVKPLGRLLEGHVMVTSSTILGDGHVAFILDVPSIVSEAERRRKSIDISAGHS